MIDRKIVQRGGKEFVVSTVLPEGPASSAADVLPADNSDNTGTDEDSPENEEG